MKKYDISPLETLAVEDLMLEHGMLNRILLIYEECASRLSSCKQISLLALHDMAMIVRTFIEDYHEKNEEQFMFAICLKHGQLVDMINELTIQHTTGRVLTDTILALTGKTDLTHHESQELMQNLTNFVIMYRAHESREDTEVFRVFKKLITPEEYMTISDYCESSEHKLFGEHAITRFLEQIKKVEQDLGINKTEHYTR